ncbi:helix-turn-helix domain-containing protein [Streptomyces sp. GSL17-111]|uniref:helix-turn-helix domain-containing protein n=1 Tax=Streptomyces sp. GSL17-111 TaxID=3121596 RepID=UPI0030F3EB82
MPDEQFGPGDHAPLDSLREILAVLREIERLLDAMLHLLEKSGDRRPVPSASPGAGVPGESPPRTPPPRGTGQHRSLTPREGEIHALLLTGASNRAIARRLGITERTVKNNLHAVYRKLGVSGRAEAMARFLPSASETDAADAAGTPPLGGVSGPGAAPGRRSSSAD